MSKRGTYETLLLEKELEVDPMGIKPQTNICSERAGDDYLLCAQEYVFPCWFETESNSTVSLLL